MNNQERKSVQIPAGLHRVLRMISAQKGCSISALLIEYVCHGVDEAELPEDYRVVLHDLQDESGCKSNL